MSAAAPELRDNLTERGKKIVELAEKKAGTTFRIYASPYRGNDTFCREDGIEVCVTSGVESTDYYLAHELGHAVRKARGDEPAKVSAAYDHIDANHDLRSDKKRKNEYLQGLERRVRDLLYQEEVEAWRIARSWFDELEDDHDPAVLAGLESKALEGYRAGLLYD